MFSEAFIVQIRQKFRKMYSEVHIQGKKKSENTFRILKPRTKKEIRGGKRGVGWG
jgi:CRISPR/Cas system type I-B associated protein Csh2 (Cas7 group RAMP superfamily)